MHLQVFQRVVWASEEQSQQYGILFSNDSRPKAGMENVGRVLCAAPLPDRFLAFLPISDGFRAFQIFARPRLNGLNVKPAKMVSVNSTVL